MRRDAFFKVDASLMQQLGASLISDDLQCLIELIKNAYDADATNVKVVIEAPNQIVVEDNGHGMNEPAIERGWLTISNSLKFEQKRRGILTTKQQRTPLGDKGLGRLSTQRLGNKLSIETSPEASNTTFVVEIDWSTFQAGTELSTIPVQFETHERGSRRTGTKLTISQLLEPDNWTSLKSEELRLSLASLVSPYSGVANFHLQAFLNGVEVSPSVVSTNLRQAAWQHLSLKFDGKLLLLSGTMKAYVLRGAQQKSKEDYDRFFLADNGQAFLNELLASPRSKSYNIAKSTGEGAFIDFALTRSFTDVIAKNGYSNPGQFVGEIDAFTFNSQGNLEAIQETDALTPMNVIRQLIKDLSGIRVYRDGFAVRTAHDWLRLSEWQTSGGSYYGLRPANTMGYVALSAINNAVLRETTDREGFIEDSFYRGFYEIMQSFVKSANDVTEHFRRSWNEYARKQNDLQQDLPSRDPRVIEQRLNESFGRVDDAKGLLGQAARAISKSMETTDNSLFPADPKLASTISDAQDLLLQASETLDAVNARRGLAGLLATEVEALNTRIGEVYELVSLGITAEALSHDISVILDRLAVETNSIQKHARTVNLDDLDVLRYFEVVRTTVSALEKQLGHLDPALKYTREKRDTFGIVSFLEDAAPYYRERLSKRSIALTIDTTVDFVVSMNKGKLIQVLDNLVLNSEYWVEASSKRSGNGKFIKILVNRPQLIVEDSGDGVEPAYEESLFDPFITAKPKGEGRGLGLFIATQLMAMDGCHLLLLPDKNDVGRRFRLAIDLGGVVQNA